MLFQRKQNVKSEALCFLRRGKLGHKENKNGNQEIKKKMKRKKKKENIIGKKKLNKIIK